MSPTPSPSQSVVPNGGLNHECLRRGEIVAVTQDGTNLYDVLLAGAMYPYSKVPALNFTPLAVGSNVVVDVSDPQTPTIISSTGIEAQYLGQREAYPYDVQDDGWLFNEGTWQHSGRLVNPVVDWVPQGWMLPYSYSFARLCSWSDSTGTQREAFVAHYVYENGSAYVFAYDTKNSYTLAANMPDTTTLAVNSTAVTAFVSTTSPKDVGKYVVLYGENASGVFISDRINIQPGNYGTGRYAFKTICKAEIRSPYPTGTKGAFLTCVGDITISCGAIHYTLPAGTQMEMFDKIEVELVPTTESADAVPVSGENIGTPYLLLSIQQNSFLIIDEEICQVAGVNGTKVILGARALFGTGPPKSHVKDSPVMVSFWGDSKFVMSASPRITHALIYSNVLYLTSTVTKSNGKLATSLFASDVRTGDYLWNLPLYGEWSDNNASNHKVYGMGLVRDQVPNPIDPLAPAEPILVFSPADAINWDPTSNPYGNKSQNTEGYEDGLVVVWTGEGFAAMNRRTGFKVWEKPTSAVLDNLSSTFSSGSIVEYVLADSRFCRFNVIPSGFVVTPYVRVVTLEVTAAYTAPDNKTWANRPEVRTIHWAVGFKILEAATGNLLNTYEFNVSSHIVRSSQDWPFGVCKTVPSPDGLGLDYIMILDEVLTYDVPPGEYRSSTQSTVDTEYRYTYQFEGTPIATSSKRILCFRVGVDGAVSKVYDNALLFPPTIDSHANPASTEIYGVFPDIPVRTEVFEAPIGYVEGSEHSFLVLLVRENGYKYTAKASVEDIQVYTGSDGLEYVSTASQPLDMNSLPTGVTVTYSHLRKLGAWYGFAFFAGMRVMLVDMRAGSVFAISSSYINSPQAAEAAVGGGKLTKLQNTVFRSPVFDKSVYTLSEWFAWLAAYSSEDPATINIDAVPEAHPYTYHNPVLGLTQNVVAIKQPMFDGVDNGGHPTVAIQTVNLTTANLNTTQSHAYMNQSVSPSNLGSYYGNAYFYTVQAADGTLFFGRQQIGYAPTQPT